MKCFLTNAALNRLGALMLETKVPAKDQTFVMDTVKPGMDAQQIGPAVISTPCGKVFIFNIDEVWFDTKTPTIVKAPGALLKGLIEQKPAH